MNYLIVGSLFANKTGLLFEIDNTKQRRATGLRKNIKFSCNEAVPTLSCFFAMHYANYIPGCDKPTIIILFSNVFTPVAAICQSGEYLL